MTPDPPPTIRPDDIVRIAKPLTDAQRLKLYEIWQRYFGAIPELHEGRAG